MFITFFWKSIVWMAVGGFLFAFIFAALTIVPALLATKIKQPSVQKILGFITVGLSFYGLSIICGFFALRSIWYSSQDGVEYPWIYHVFSVLLAYGEISYMGHKGVKDQDDLKNVGLISFISIPITILFIFFDDLPRVIYPFLNYWY